MVITALKRYLFFVVTLASVTLVLADKSDEGVKEICKYPNTLTLTSSPNGKVVDGQNCNAEFDKLEWKEEPIIKYGAAKTDKTYTLMCIDPDPPAYEKGQFWLHWLVSSIKGDDFIDGDLSKAKHLMNYYGPAPPSGSGLHRYMFLAFEENEANPLLDAPARRSKFELGPWLKNHPDLNGPVAGIQFRTKY